MRRTRRVASSGAYVIQASVACALFALALIGPAHSSLAVPASSPSQTVPASMPDPPAAAAPSGTIDLVCKGITYTLATGSGAGDCLLEPGVRALCEDRDSDSAYARCDTGCQASSGAGSCNLGGEEVYGGTFILTCEGGARFLLRTGTGRGTCRLDAGSSGREARCSDTKNHSVAATCAQGCVSPRGKGFCGKYKADAPPQ